MLRRIGIAMLLLVYLALGPSVRFAGAAVSPCQTAKVYKAGRDFHPPTTQFEPRGDRATIFVWLGDFNCDNQSSRSSNSFVKLYGESSGDGFGWAGFEISGTSHPWHTWSQRRSTAYSAVKTYYAAAQSQTSYEYRVARSEENQRLEFYVGTTQMGHTSWGSRRRMGWTLRNRPGWVGQQPSKRCSCLHQHRG